MQFKDQLFETLKKKAFGFSYTEETAEYESLRPKNFLFCEKRKRLYTPRGYLKVKKLAGGVEIISKKISLNTANKLKNVTFTIKT